MIKLILFSINILVPVGKPNYNLSFKELKRNIEIKKEEFLSKYPLLKDRIKIKKELILSQKLLVEIPDSLLSYFKTLGIPYNPDYLIPAPKLIHSDNNNGFWHKNFIRADTFYKLGIKGKGNVVVILDTGVDTSHPELKNKVILFKDFVSYSPPSDPVGHGTFVAGLIAGDSSGIAPETRLIVLKVFSEYGGTFSDIHEAFDYVAELIDRGINIKILNGSFGTHPYVDEFFSDLFYLKNKGVFLCFAAGNEGSSSGTTSSPGNYPFVFSAGACDSSYNITNFSSRGPSPFREPWNDTTYWFFNDWDFTSPFLIAPGKDIKSSFPGNQYLIADGTSASSPIFAGALSLILSYNPFLTPDSFAKILRNNLYKKSGNNYPNYEEGYGYLDLKILIGAIERKDTLIFNVSNFNIESKTFPFFVNDTFSVSLNLISNKIYTDSLRIRILNNSNVRLFDTLFNFRGTDELNLTAQAVFLNYPSDDTLRFSFILSGSNFSKLFEIKEKIRGDTLLTFKNKNYKFTVSGTGALGFSNSEQIKGEGFVYKDFGNLLYYGSFAFGNSFNYIVDRFYEKFNIDDRDTKPLKIGDNYFVKQGNEISFEFSDDYAQHPKGNVLKISVKDLGEGFLIKMKTQNFVDENTYLGLFLDPDIVNALTNFADYDSASKILFTSNSGGPVFGILDIDEGTLCGVIKNEDYAYPYGGLPDSLQYLFMKGEIREFRKDIGDYSIFISKKIIPPDSLQFVLFAGENFDTLLVKRRKILDKLNLGERNNFKGISRIYPNPFIDPYQNELKIETFGKGKIVFYDVTGRKTFEVNSLSEGLNLIKLRNFKNSGIYFLKFEGKKRVYKLIYLNLR